MNGNGTSNHWLHKVREAIRLIEFSLLVGEKVDTSRLRIEKARDLVLDVMLTMNGNGDAKRRPTLFKDLTHASDLMTACIIAHPLAFTVLREAVQVLRAARDLEVRS